MVETWSAVGVAALATVASLIRELVALRRHRVRRDNLEHLVTGTRQCLRVIDRDVDGAIIDITTSAAVLADEPRHSGDLRRRGE